MGKLTLARRKIRRSILKSLMARLEQEAAKVYSEIEVYIRKLRAWAAEVKILVATVAESQQSREK
jgi:hypothetical protein